jgi:FixJ family two-component response regulator
MRGGAYDLVNKPFSRDELLFPVRRALDRVRLKYQNEWLRSDRA